MLGAGANWLVQRLAYPTVIGVGIGAYAALLGAGVPVQLGCYGSIAGGLLLIVRLERWMPYRRQWKTGVSGFRTDLAFLLIVQVALPVTLTLATASALGSFSRGHGIAKWWPHAWPLAAQFAVLLVVADALRYGLHVAAHRGATLWRLHALHHAPTSLYALTVGRFHPLERVLQYTLEALPFALLGVSAEVLALYVVFHSLHGFLQHANINVRLGVLNYVLSGPELHRWHHSRLARESNANYGNHLAIWDLLFSTYFLPAGRKVSALGLRNRYYPERFAAQLRAPFCGPLDRVAGPVLSWRDIALNALLRTRMAWSYWRGWRPLVAAAARPGSTQLAVLRRILAVNRTTEFGRTHGFASIATVEEFRRRVPVQTYDSLRPYIAAHQSTGKASLSAAPPILYAQTSGTTGAPRYFPVSRAGLARHRWCQAVFAYVQYRDVPGAYAGRILAVVSPAVEGRLPGGQPFGSLSGALYRAMSRLARAKYVVPAAVFDVADHELRYLLILRLALAESNITAMATANPSTFLRLISLLCRHRAELLADLAHDRFSRFAELPAHVRRAVASRLTCDRARLEALHRALTRARPSFADLWPHLRLVSTWTGGSCAIALQRVRALLPPAARIAELGYLASEFRGSLAVDAASHAGIPALWETFFEFVDKESWERGVGAFRRLEDLELGREYYVFATTADGLYRYDINDIVRVDGRFLATPTIAFVQKGKGVTNITGEKLYEAQVLDAVNAAARELGGAPCFFIMLADVAGARYRLLIEYDAGFAPEPGRLAARIDALLGERNIEYRGKRTSGRLADLAVCPLRAGWADAYRAWCVANGQREGQFKIVALRYAADLDFAYTAWLADRGSAAQDAGTGSQQSDPDPRPLTPAPVL